MLNDDQQAEVLIEQEEEDKLRKQLAEKTAQRDELLVRSPMTGLVMSRLLMEREGVWLEQGTELLRVGNANGREVLIAIAQQDIEAFEEQQHKSVLVHTPDGSERQGNLSRIEPKSDSQPPHESLSAANGGTLAVRASDDEKSELELVEPRFRGTVSMRNEDARLMPGQRATVTLNERNRSLGQGLYDTVSDKVTDMLATAKQTSRQ